MLTSGAINGFNNSTRIQSDVRFPSRAPQGSAGHVFDCLYENVKSATCKDSWYPNRPTPTKLQRILRLAPTFSVAAARSMARVRFTNSASLACVRTRGVRTADAWPRQWTQKSHRQGRQFHKIRVQLEIVKRGSPCDSGVYSRQKKTTTGVGAQRGVKNVVVVVRGK